MEAFEPFGGPVKNILCEERISNENPWIGKINWEESPISLTLEDFRMINETTNIADTNNQHGRELESQSSQFNKLDKSKRTSLKRKQFPLDTDTLAAERTSTKISVENSETFELFEQSNKKEKSELLNNLTKAKDIPLNPSHSSRDKRSLKEVLTVLNSAKDSPPIKQPRLKSTKKVIPAEKFFIKLRSLRSSGSSAKKAKSKKLKRIKRLNGISDAKNHAWKAESSKVANIETESGSVNLISIEVAEKNFRGFRYIEVEAAEKLMKTYKTITLQQENGLAPPGNGNHHTKFQDDLIDENDKKRFMFVVGKTSAIPKSVSESMESTIIATKKIFLQNNAQILLEPSDIIELYSQDFDSVAKEMKEM